MQLTPDNNIEIDPIVETQTETAQPLASSRIDQIENSSFDNTPLLDLNVIGSLLDVIGEPSLHKMLAVFCQETQMRIDTLRQISLVDELDKVEDEAHTLKSSSGSFGAAKLYAAAKVLEAAARNKQQPIAPLVEDTLNIAEQSINALKHAYLSNK